MVACARRSEVLGECQKGASSLSGVSDLLAPKVIRLVFDEGNTG